MCHSPVPSPSYIPRDHHLVELLERLENEEKTFVAHDLLDDINGQTIAQYIDERLLELLGCRLIELEDKNMAERICYAFFKRKESIRWWRKMSKFPLFEGLLLAFIFNKMRKQFNDVHEPLVGDQYEELRDKMDEECTRLLQICYREDEEETRFSLQLNYHTFIHVGECKDHRIQLMEVAYTANALKFLAHPACQKAIDLRWQPSYRLDQTSFMPFVFYFCPILFFIHNTEPYAKTTEPFAKRLYMFYSSTSSKYVIHMVFRVLYVLLYAVALIRLSSKSMVRNNYMDYWEQLAVIGWQFTYLLEMTVIAAQGKFMYWSTRNQVDFYRNVLISINMITLILSMMFVSTRHILVPIADACFYLSFLLAVIRSMRVLYVDSFFGAIVHMLSKMVPIMVKFGLIFLLFWMSFAVCYISITGHLHHGNHSYAGLPWQMFIHGAFEIFGEANDADKEGVIPGCEDFDLSTYKDSSFHCLFRTWMVPLLLFSYMLVSGILLVNVLTALLTKEYDEVSKDYHLYWKSMLYARLAEYEEKLWIPAPFSMIVYILQIPFEIVLNQKKRLQRWHANRRRRRNGALDEVMVRSYVAEPQPEPESFEMIPMADDIEDEPQNPLPERPDNLQLPFSNDDQPSTSAVEKSEVPEELPKPSSSKKVITFRNVGLRPGGRYARYGDRVAFQSQGSGTSSNNRTPNSPLDVVGAVMDRTREGAATVAGAPNMTDEEKALAFIQERRNVLLQEQSMEVTKTREMQRAIEKMMGKFDLASRSRGRTE